MLHKLPCPEIRYQNVSFRLLVALLMRLHLNLLRRQQKCCIFLNFLCIFFWHCNQKCLSAGNNSFFLKAAGSNTSLFRCCLSALFVDIIMALLPLLLLLLLLSCCNVCCCCKLHAFALDKQTRRKGWQEKSTRSREICMFLLPVDFHFRWQSRRRGVVYIYDWGVARPCEG